MKKIVILLFSLILLLSLSICANAQTAFVYQDDDSGVQLTLPAGWDLEYHDDDALMKVSFLPEEDPSAVMRYGSSDLWNRLDPAKRGERSKYGNRHYTKADVADLVGCPEKDVRRITMDGREYYRADFAQEVTSGKTSFTLDMTFWVRYENGWVTLFQYIGSPSNDLYKQFRDVVATASCEAPKEDTAEETYQKAVDAYQAEEYEQARELFSTVAGHGDSSRYLRLLRIRDAGGNAAMGEGVYDADLALTEEEKEDIAEAAKDFAFADTARVLLCNSDVASHYLTGLWEGGSGYFIRFKESDSGSSYTIGAKLSTQRPEQFTIADGILYGEDPDSPILKLTLTAPDTLDVLTYEKDSKTYPLTRK